MTAIAKVSRLFGNSGEMSINLYDTFPEKINLKEPVYAVVDGLPVPLFFERFERKGRRGAVVTFADIDTPDRAAEFMGLELFFADQDEGAEELGAAADPAELIGCRAVVVVVDEEEGDEVGGETGETPGRAEGEGEGAGRFEGEITDFYDSDLNPLFEVTIAGREILIPATEEFISGFDPESGTMEFTIPEGLADLN